MRNDRGRRGVVLMLAATLAVVLSAAGCGTLSEKKDKPKVGSGSIKAISALKGQQVRVGSKEFDEQLLLGQIAIVALQAAGAKPVDKTNITGSNNVRKALTGNSIDLYWEYTGTAWVSFLGQTKNITDPAGLYDAVKQKDAANDITWWARSPANDTYAMAANADVAKKYDLKTISDYAALAKKNPSAAKTCVGPEFKSRDDGFAGIRKTYGFQLPESDIKTVNDAVVYPTVGKGSSCSFGSVASTDGRVVAQHLVLLQDDKSFFPIYNPAISIRSAVATKYPQLQAVFTKIAAKLDSKTLTSLNKQVSVDGEDPNDVAQEWLSKNGFIS